jgi:hypothetical protein
MRAWLVFASGPGDVKVLGPATPPRTQVSAVRLLPVREDLRVLPGRRRPAVLRLVECGVNEGFMPGRRRVARWSRMVNGRILAGLEWSTGGGPSVFLLGEHELNMSLVGLLTLFLVNMHCPFREARSRRVIIHICSYSAVVAIGIRTRRDAFAAHRHKPDRGQGWVRAPHRGPTYDDGELCSVISGLVSWSVSAEFWWHFATTKTPG